MKDTKYELVSQTNKPHWKSRQVAKFQWVWSILIFNDLVWNNYISICHTNMPEKWSKIENSKNSLKISINFTCSHLHNTFRFWLKLEILVATDSTPFGILWLNVHKNFCKNLFFCIKWIKKIPTKIKIHLDAKKGFLIAQLKLSDYNIWPVCEWVTCHTFWALWLVDAWPKLRLSLVTISLLSKPLLRPT